MLGCFACPQALAGARNLTLGECQVGLGYEATPLASGISHSKTPDAAMTEDPPVDIGPFTTPDLSSITPESLSPTSLLSGIITIKWPFSSSSQKLTFLLADPDPRKRAQEGQVKITLLGEAAQYLDQIESGEQISIAAADNTSPLIESESTTPRVKFHITFPQGCVILVLPHPSHR